MLIPDCFTKIKTEYAEMWLRNVGD